MCPGSCRNFTGSKEHEWKISVRIPGHQDMSGIFCILLFKEKFFSAFPCSTCIFRDGIHGWGLPHCTSGRKHVQLLNYVIAITFITSIPQSSSSSPPKTKALVPKLYFSCVFHEFSDPPWYSLSFFLPDITDTSPTAEGNKEKAWTAGKDITFRPSQIKNTFSLSSIKLNLPKADFVPDSRNIAEATRVYTQFCAQRMTPFLRWQKQVHEEGVRKLSINAFTENMLVFHKVTVNI